MNALIFAGGSGSRLWPASRKSTPKQILSFFGDLTMLEKTYQRINRGIPKEKVFVAAGESYSDEIKKQLSEVPLTNFLLEPERKNRGPALGVLVLLLNHYSDDPYFTTVWSDDHINQEEVYHSTLKQIEKHLQAKPNDIVAIGVAPNHPNTSFRYVHVGELDGVNGTQVYKVASFVDKPNQKEAKKIYNSGRHFWNTGYFISSVQAILGVYKEHFKDCYDLLMELQPFIGTDQQAQKIKEIYLKMPSFDFEELFFEKPELLKMAPANFDWMDLGKWDAIKDAQSEKQENLFQGLHVDHNSESTLVFNYNPNQLVTTLHVNNLIVVVTPEAVLVANKDQAGDLKKIIEKLEENPELKKYL